jgi:hypothetical protein
MELDNIMTQLLIAIIGSSAITTLALWIIFFKWKKEALLSRLMAEGAKNRSDRWEIMNVRIDKQMDIIEKLREKVDHGEVLRITMRSHIGVLFRNCECTDNQEIDSIRKMYYT